MTSLQLTIGITSFNRFKYLKSLLKSMEDFDRNKIQFIVVDTGSSEPGLREFLFETHKNGLIDSLFLFDEDKRSWTNDEYKAKNIIIKESKSDVILFLQDDLECASSEKSLLDAVSGFRELDVLCCEMNAVRTTTIKSNYQNHPMLIANYTRFWLPTNNHFHTMGLFKKQVFQKFGLYPTEWPETQEFWGRSEDFYDTLLKENLPQRQLNASCWVPHFLPVWNDPRGGYAFIRGNKRYGHYLSPVAERYYQKIPDEKYDDIIISRLPLSFSDVSVSIGWEYAKDGFGDQLKYPQSNVVLEGPEQEI
jgi:glycosyltransferase involved in cell wall biosynthesis